MSIGAQDPEYAGGADGGASVKGSHYSPHRNTPVKDAGVKDLEESHNETSRQSVGATMKKKTTIQKIKEFHTKRRSERFYRFLNHDLPTGIKAVGGMTVLFHWIYSLVIEFYRTYCGFGENSFLLHFVDAVMRLWVNTLFLYVVYTQNPEVWHAAGYGWLALSFWASTFTGPFQVIIILVGLVCFGLAAVICGRELWLYLHAPRVYMAFVRHASLIDDRGKILFYKHVKAALLDAGLQEVDDFKLNVFLAEMGVLTDAVTVTDEISLYFDQFMDLHDNYKAFIEENPASSLSVGAQQPGGIQLASTQMRGADSGTYQESYLAEEYPNPPPPVSHGGSTKLEQSAAVGGGGARLEEIRIDDWPARQAAGGGGANESIQIDEDEELDEKK